MAIAVSRTKDMFRHRWSAAAALFLAAFMNILDVTIVNLALPAIRDDLRATSTELQWVLVIYVLTFAAGLLPCGRFGDVFGRRRVFNWGVVGFVLSATACALAPDVDTLIVGRAVQGLAGAMMVPQVLAITHVVFPAEEKGKVIGLFGVFNGLGAVVGPLIGGAIVSADIGGLAWRPVFLIHIPLGFLSVSGALRFVPEVRTERTIVPDWAGSALFAMSITCLTFPLVEGRHLGWPLWCFGLMALSGGIAVLFLLLQARRAVGGRAQLLPVSLLKDRTFVLGLAVVTLFFSGIAGVVFMLAVLLQSGFGFPPLQAGLALVPHPAGVMVASLVTGRLGSRWLQARSAVGAALLLVGMGWLQVTVGDAGARLTGWDFLLPLLIVGVGIGTAMAALFQSVLSRVAGPDAGAGSGVLQAFQQVGIAVSIALIGQVFFFVLERSPDQAAYAAAAKAALWYPICVYLVLAMVCTWTARRTAKE